MSAGPFDHPWLSRLLGDEEVGAQFSLEAELVAMLRFESALATAEAAEGVIPVDAGDHLVRRLSAFVPDIEAIAEATARDGVPVPELVRQMRAYAGSQAQHVHFGATSQDVIDTCLVLRLGPVLDTLTRRLRTLDAALADLNRRFGENPLMGRTRMKDAVPIRVSDRVGTWRDPLERHLKRVAELRPWLLVLQFGGAAGTLDQLGSKGSAVAQRLAALLELSLPSRPWHSQRDVLAELAGWLSLVSGSLGKIGADLTLMTQNAIREVMLQGGGTSSAMPHKQNPVAAEILVTLAHFNATLVGGMHQSLVHEQERSGSAWTLEWMLLPQMAVATAAGLRTATTLCGQITHLGAS